jgi:hypothetical protein
MGSISIPLEWFINQWSVCMTFAALVYNYKFNPHNSRLIAASFSVAAIYCIGHFTLGWINELISLTANQYRYSSRLFLYVIGVLILSFFTKKTGAGFVTYLVFGNFFIAIALQFSLHVDRNVIGLNRIGEYFETGEVIINSVPKTGYWGLWDLYTTGLNASAVVLVSYLLVGEKIKEVKCSQQG